MLSDKEKRVQGIPGFEGCCERQKRGVSSFQMHDGKRVFQEIGLKKGQSFLDIGCGAGDYALCAAKIVGDSGVVYALDRWMSVVGALAEKSVAQGVRNIRPMHGDIAKDLPLEDSSVDVCLMATILHALDFSMIGDTLFSNIKRVLKVGGWLVTIDVKKEESLGGPPMHIRLAPSEIEEALRPYGFRRASYCDLGYTYMLKFSCEGS